MIHLTNEDYRRLAMLIEDKSCEKKGDFSAMLEYDTDRFNGNLTVDVMPYEDGIYEGLFIVQAEFTTCDKDGIVSNDFDISRLRADSYLQVA